MSRRLVSPTSFVMLAQVLHCTTKPRKASYDAEKARESLSMLRISFFFFWVGTRDTLSCKASEGVCECHLPWNLCLCLQVADWMVGFDSSMVVELHPFATNG